MQPLIEEYTIHVLAHELLKGHISCHIQAHMPERRELGMIPQWNKGSCCYEQRSRFYRGRSSS